MKNVCVGPIKRRKLWGEPVDSSSAKQIQRDNLMYKRAF